MSMDADTERRLDTCVSKLDGLSARADALLRRRVRRDRSTATRFTVSVSGTKGGEEHTFRIELKAFSAAEARKEAEGIAERKGLKVASSRCDADKPSDYLGPKDREAVEKVLNRRGKRDEEEPNSFDLRIRDATGRDMYMVAGDLKGIESSKAHAQKLIQEYKRNGERGKGHSGASPYKIVVEKYYDPSAEQKKSRKVV
jgi:hypothetical protein